MSSVKTMQAGLSFFLIIIMICDNWFYRLKALIRNEPFVVPQRFLDQVKDNLKGDYLIGRLISRSVRLKRNAIIHGENALSRVEFVMCDEYLGKVLGCLWTVDLPGRIQCWLSIPIMASLMGEHNGWGKIKFKAPVFRNPPIFAILSP